jgi:hypothetical protein
MTDCPPFSAPASLSEEQAVFSLNSAVRQLPTLQRNALRKIFDRHEFSPEEVASLGYRRLQQAEGIGHKGLAAIAEWLHSHGFELKPPDVVANPMSPIPKRMRRNIESAVRLLRTHGYVVQQRTDNVPEEKGVG